MYDRREEFDEINTPSVLAYEIQRATERIIQNTHDVDWSEDYITIRVLGVIRDILSNYKIPYLDGDIFANKFDVEAYKLTGKPETNHGDIAIVVTRVFPHTCKVTSGVAFYEAKAASNNHHNKRFPSFCVQQLRRLVTNTPRLTYLLYDRNAKHIHSIDWPMSTIDMKDYGKYPMSRMYSYTVDANLLKNMRNIDEVANLYGRSFGEHFVKCVLSGRELDYSRNVTKTISMWLKHTKNSNPLVVSITSHEPNEDLSSFQLQLPSMEQIELPASNQLKPKPV